jgi:hypothetical protein
MEGRFSPYQKISPISFMGAGPIRAQKPLLKSPLRDGQKGPKEPAPVFQSQATSPSSKKEGGEFPFYFLLGPKPDSLPSIKYGKPIVWVDFPFLHQADSKGRSKASFKKETRMSLLFL